MPQCSSTKTDTPLLPQAACSCTTLGWPAQMPRAFASFTTSSTPRKNALKKFPTAPCPSQAPVAFRSSKAAVVGRGGGRANAGRIKIETSQIKWTLAPKRNKKPRSQEKKKEWGKSCRRPPHLLKLWRPFKHKTPLLWQSFASYCCLSMPQPCQVLIHVIAGRDEASRAQSPAVVSMST